MILESLQWKKSWELKTEVKYILNGGYHMENRATFLRHKAFGGS